MLAKSRIVRSLMRHRPFWALYLSQAKTMKLIVLTDKKYVIAKCSGLFRME